MGIQGKILIVDDEPEALENCRRILSRLQYECLIEHDSSRAVDVLERERPGLVLTDLRMPGVDGIGILNAAKQLDPDVQVVLLTAYSSVQTAVSCMRQGAFDYLTKPFSSAQLEEVTKRAFGETLDSAAGTDPDHSPVKNFRPMLPSRNAQRELMIGESEAMRRVGDLIRRVAPTPANVLIYGESGTGKELAARAIHAHSGRAGRAFVPVDCAALPDTLLESELFGHERGAFTGAHVSKLGLFELAEGGTVFLDEVSAMSDVLQSRLLRVLQERQVRRVGGTRFLNIDVRIVAASNRDLADASRSEQFRHDLYYRLNVIQITLPPLRTRGGDVPLLAKTFLARCAASHSRPLAFDADALEVLSRYDWPGNVRELQNVIERAAALADGPIIRVQHLPDGLQDLRRHHTDATGSATHEEANGFKEAKQEVVRSFERQFLLDLLKRHQGHLGHVAKEAGVDRKTIERMVKKHGLRSPF
ncbi:MAG TPA: sigma-54 dependent transcriptional regulator [Nitrospiraceae bacterium]|nr:sigma-54 dependent transcriptional regulator [Nitrospiraceae bacterium]